MSKSGEPRKILQDMHEAMNKRDFDKAVSFFADDAVDASPDGTFKGKAEVKRHFEWMAKQAEKAGVNDMKLIEIGIYAEGNMVTHLFAMEGTTKNGKMSIPSAAVAEFKDGKVQRISSYYDRLALAKAMASGLIATRTVNAIVSQMEKGLH
jgi:ketosteroid isomerase-like protein